MNHRPTKLVFSITLGIGLSLGGVPPARAQESETPPVQAPPAFDVMRFDFCPAGAGRALSYREARWCSLPAPPSCPGWAESCAMVRNPVGLKLEESPRYPVHDVSEEHLEELEPETPPVAAEAPGGDGSGEGSTAEPVVEEPARESTSALKWFLVALLVAGLALVVLAIVRAMSAFRLPAKTVTGEYIAESKDSAQDAPPPSVSAPDSQAASPVQLTLTQEATRLHNQGRTAQALQLLAAGTIQFLAGRQWIRVRRSATFGDYLVMLSGRPASRAAARDVFRAAEIGRYAPERASDQVWARALRGFEQLQQEVE